MAISKRGKTYKTGHLTVDGQHTELFAMVKELHDAITANKDKDILFPKLEKLAKYTVEHFRTEENLMSRINYPHFEKHREKHQALTQEVQEIVEKYRSGKAVLSLTLSSYLAKWLQHHIREDDAALAEYLTEKPESSAAKAGWSLQNKKSNN